MSARPIALLAIALFATACVGATGEPEAWLGSFGPPNSGVALGLIAGETFNVQSVLSTVRPLGAGSSEGVIVLSDVPNFCAMIESSSLSATAHFLVIHAIEADPTAPAPMKSPSAPESLRVYPANAAPSTGKLAAVDYFRAGGGCTGATTPVISAMKGTLVIDRIDLNAVYTGIADFRTTIGEHDRVTFAAATCSSQAVANLLAGTLACN